MNQRFSDAYAKLQAQFHKERPDYGISGHNYADQIHQMAQRLQTRSILDYGCGKATLQKSIPFPIQNYDPFIEEYAERPTPADLVVCTDVMEHIEEEYVESVLSDIASLTKRAVFFQIATSPAKKTLPDGRNAHITIRSPNEWLMDLMRFFDIKSFMVMPGGMVVVAAPQGSVSPNAEPV